LQDRKRGTFGPYPFESRREIRGQSQSKNPLENPPLGRAIFSSSMPVRAKTDIFAEKPVYRSIPRCASALMRTRKEHAYRSGFQELIVIPRPLPFAYEKNTSFECDRPASDIFRALHAALRSSNCQIDPKPHKGKIKCCGKIMDQDIRFQVHIFTKQQGQDGHGHVVEFQRRSGDSCCFWHLFADTMITLSMDLADAATFVERSNLKKSRDTMKICSSSSLKQSSCPLDELAESLEHM